MSPSSGQELRPVLLCFLQERSSGDSQLFLRLLLLLFKMHNNTALFIKSVPSLFALFFMRTDLNIAKNLLILGFIHERSQSRLVIQGVSHHNLLSPPLQFAVELLGNILLDDEPGGCRAYFADSPKNAKLQHKPLPNHPSKLVASTLNLI